MLPTTVHSIQHAPLRADVPRTAPRNRTRGIVSKFCAQQPRLVHHASDVHSAHFGLAQAAQRPLNISAHAAAKAFGPETVQDAEKPDWLRSVNFLVAVILLVARTMPTLHACTDV